jgi:hypothetical protein
MTALEVRRSVDFWILSALLGAMTFGVMLIFFVW